MQSFYTGENMTKYIISLDFDGCFFNTKYLEALKSQPLIRTQAMIKENVTLIDYINSQTAAVDSVTLMVGSNRQSNKLDMRNGLKHTKYSFKSSDQTNSGSCYSAMEHFCKELNRQLLQSKDEKKEKFRVDKFLLADLYNEKEDGFSFDMALKEIAWDKIDLPAHQDASGNESAELIEEHQLHPETITDNTKISLLYAQIHKIAASPSANITDSILFEFIDDLDTILEQISKFFSEHTDLLPKNVTLKLVQYPHKEGIFLYQTIKGKGEIDYNYKQNVIALTKLAGFEISGDLSKALKISNIYSVVNEFMENRNLQKAPTISPVIHKSNKRKFFSSTINDVSDSKADKEEKNEEKSFKLTLPLHLQKAPTISPSSPRSKKGSFFSSTINEDSDNKSDKEGEIEEESIIKTQPVFKRARM
jgi:hypothetical protein